MKQLIRKLLVLFAVLALAGSVTALAAQEPSTANQAPVIAVQLDGEALTFTDAVPQVRDSRTFLPFRAVFEAMGAQVSNEGNVITATRGDRSLTMTIGQSEARITTGGITLPLTMDVAPYVDTTTWRTYVPVRFAAQALGCAVGWDQEAYTAILVDTDKLVDAALEGKQFTYLDKFMDYSQRYSEGIWNSELTLTGKMDIAQEGLTLTVPLAAKVKGITQDQTKLEMDMNMTLDMSAMLDLLQADAQAAGVPVSIEPEEQALVDALAKEGIGLAIRGDLGEGQLALAMNGQVLDAVGIPQDTWLSMDLDALYTRLGIDYETLLTSASSQSFDPAVLIKAFLAQLTPTSAGGEGYGVSYQTFVDSAESAALALSDQGFTKAGNDYTCAIDGGLAKLSLTLTMKGGKVVGYTMVATMAQNVSDVDFTMTMDMAVDEKDQVSATVNTGMASAGSLMHMDMTLTGGYTKGKTAPQTQPPEGAGVFDLGALLGMGV